MSLETAPSREEPRKDEAPCGDAGKDSMHRETAQASSRGLMSFQKISSKPLRGLIHRDSRVKWRGVDPMGISMSRVKQTLHGELALMQ